MTTEERQTFIEIGKRLAEYPPWIAAAAEEISLEAYCGPADYRQAPMIAEIIFKHAFARMPP